VPPREIFTWIQRRKQERGEMKYPTTWKKGKYPYRFVDENTIEMQVGKGKVLVADAEDLQKLCSYESILVNMPQVYGVEGNKRENLTKLLYGDRVKFRNNNPLDIRRENIVPTYLYKLQEAEEASLAYSGQYKYMEAYEHGEYHKLPRDKWCLGKPGGCVTINKRQGACCLLIKKGNMMYSHSLTFRDNESKKRAEKVLRREQIEQSYKMGLTRNMVRLVDDVTIEVQIGDDKIMKTDLGCLKLVHDTSIHYAQGYAHCHVDGITQGFHQLVFGKVANGKMIDHIDRDPLNNNRSNLREASRMMNNRNAGAKSNSMGVSKMGDNYIAKLNDSGRVKSRCFSIAKYGRGIARQLAMIYRIKLLLLSGSQKGLGHMLKKWRLAEDVTSDESMKEVSRLSTEIALVIKETLVDIGPYKDSLKISPTDGDLHIKYIQQQLTYMDDCHERITNIKQRLAAPDTS
jgi:hypothetical protein